MGRESIHRGGDKRERRGIPYYSKDPLVNDDTRPTVAAVVL